MFILLKYIYINFWYVHVNLFEAFKMIITKEKKNNILLKIYGFTKTEKVYYDVYNDIIIFV